MSGNDSSTSESEVSACSSNYNPMKALYSQKAIVPVTSAPMFENIQQYEAAQKDKNILPVGKGKLVQEREQKKKMEKEAQEKALEEKNKQRFAQYEMVTTQPSVRNIKNVLTRMERSQGPLAALRDCVRLKLRIKVTTRHGHNVRGVLTGTLAAFDKQWNLAMTDVVEVWTRKAVKKRKVPPPSFGSPVARGTASHISPVPRVTEKPIGNGLWECTRRIPQLMVRGEHVVIINLIDR